MIGRLPDRRGPKEKSTMIHDRKGLISMNPTQSLNEFVITLGNDAWWFDHNRSLYLYHF